MDWRQELSSEPYKNIRSLILDMDGVLWRGPEQIGNLKEIFSKIKSLDISTILATNNSTRTPEQYLEKLYEFGVELEPWQILTSSQVASSYLSDLYPEGGPVYVVGEDGLVTALREKGFYHQVEGALAVVAGMDRNISYDKLSQACLLIRGGARFIGTNADRTFPTPFGLAPGAGSLLAALETATDIQAHVVGKPEADIFIEALKVLNCDPEHALVVGDRLETDIAGGQRLRCPTALVLSGVTNLAQASQWKPAPNWMLEDLESVVGRLEKGRVINESG
jgi:4-nitrophenyl phosphatase